MDRDQKFDDIIDNQLRVLTHLKVLPESVWNEAKKSKTVSLVDPHNEAAALNLRARSYLHANCRHCHRNNGGGGATIELGASFDQVGMKAVGVKPTQGTFGMTEARVISPGDPFRSVLLYRMSKLGKGRMPYSGSSMVDVKATQLIREWIERLPTSSDDGSFTVLRLRNYQRNLLSDSVQIEDQEFVSQKLREIFGTTSGALLLLDALDHRPMSERMKEQIIQLATQDKNPLVRDLFERFLPEDQRVKRLGLKIDEGALLSIQGDAREGKKLFFEMAGLQCRNCHRVHQHGKELGPDLTQNREKNYLALSCWKTSFNHQRRLMRNTTPISCRRSQARCIPAC